MASFYQYSLDITTTKDFAFTSYLVLAMGLLPKPKNDGSIYVVIGNPPFGKISSQAIRFFNKRITKQLENEWGI